MIESAQMKRAWAIFSIIVSASLALALYTPLKEFLWIHPWLQSFLGVIPAIALAFFAYLDAGHSHEANRLRGRIADLEEERNQHLRQIADNTKRPSTLAERNAAMLRPHIMARVRVMEGNGSWGDAAEIVEVSDDNIVTLFTPHGYLSPCAWSVQVRCEELEITKVPEGDCPLRLTVLKRYGQVIQWGEITKWAKRAGLPATFPKGSNVCYARYGKPGVADLRTLYVYQANNNSNSFVLESSLSAPVTGNNIEISKKFMLMQVDYEADGYSLRNGNPGSAGGPFPLYIKFNR
jgi:hypothetical protein